MTQTQVSAVQNAAAKPAVGKTFNRAADDAGNLLSIDHINLVIPDQQAATVFYIMGLGFTRDPYLRVGINNMGINIGRSQLHLPTAGRTLRGHELATQRLRGTIGYILPSLADLAKRLEKIVPLLEGTQFNYKVHDDYIEATCPWGNRVRCHGPSPEFGDTELAIAYIEFDVPRGTAPGIARFYEQGMLAITKLDKKGTDAVASVNVGTQKLFFRESDAPLPPYDDHHFQIYVSNHSVPHRFLLQHNLITDESNSHQYRFRDIVDPENGKLLFTVEHEVRSIRHPMYRKRYVNRNISDANVYRDIGNDEFIGRY